MALGIPHGTHLRTALAHNPPLNERDLLGSDIRTDIFRDPS
jgi:hypothetical protein